MKIKTKISFLFSLTFLLLFLVVASTAITYQRAEIENSVFEKLEVVVDSRKEHIETYFEQNIERLKLVTSRTKLRSLIDEYNKTENENIIPDVINILKDAASSIDEIERICVIGLEGEIIASTADEFIGMKCDGQDFYIEGKVNPTIAFIEENEQNKIIVSGPFSNDENLLGVGITVVSTAKIEEILSYSTGLGESGEILAAIAVEGGDPMFINERKFDVGTDVVVDETKAQPMREALNGAEKWFKDQLDYRGEEVISVTRYISAGNLGLVAKIDKYEAFASSRALTKVTVGMLTLALIIFVGISIVIARSISRPIELLKKGADRVKDGDLNYKNIVESSDEIGDLADTFNDMTKSIKDSRSEIDSKVEVQTREIGKQKESLEKQQKAILNILEDAEEEKDKSVLLASDLKKFKLAVENASDHIVITDAEGGVIYANNAVERITGFSPKEVIGKKAGTKENWGGIMSKELYKKLWKTIKEDKKPFEGEISNKRKNGQKYVASANITPVLNSENEVLFFVGIERDITKTKEIDRTKSEFIALASHQLRTPLSGMKWLIELMLEGDTGELNEKQKDMLGDIQTSNERMINLVNMLLKVSKIETERIVVNPKPIKISKIIEEVLVECKKEVYKKKVEIKVDTSETLPSVSGDEKMIREVYANLLNNAIQYSKEGGVINLIVKEKDGQIVSEVVDEGYGIPEKEQKDIFGKFYRATNITKIDTEGSGLGLYLSKKIIEVSGGKIWFKSKENEGSTFCFSLPIKK